MRHVRFLSTGSATPELVLSNEELIERLGLPVDSEWIERRTGIRSRHWLPPGKTTSDLVVDAARRALDEAGTKPEELDRIVLATISPDHPSPSTATIVARKLGARCPAFDLSAACAGFLYALELGAASVRGGEERVLIAAADARSRYVDPRDRRAAVLFSDGAGAALLGPAAVPGVLGVALGAEGRERMGAWIPAGGAARPASAETVAAGEHFLRVDPAPEIFELFVRYTRESVEQLLARTGVGLDEVDLFITHQGNTHMTELVRADLGLDVAKMVDVVALHGNVSGASVPLALDEMRRAGRVRAGSLVLLTAVGAGYTFGAALVRF